MSRIITAYNHGEPWGYYHNIHVKGYAFNKEGDMLSGASLASAIASAKTVEELAALALSLNGLYCAAGSTHFGSFALVDKVRSFPLFYEHTPSSVLFSDNPYLFQYSNELNSEVLLEFKSAGYCLGDKTLLNGIKQVEAATLIVFRDSVWEKVAYYSYATQNEKSETYDNAKQKLRSVLDSCMHRMVKSVSNNHIAIPLSGGYDSRFIAAWLTLNGYNNFTAFTYGRSGNCEMKLAQQVSETLGCNWIPIVYTDTVVKNIASDIFFERYVRYASTACSMPFFQDYPAINELVKGNFLPKGTVIVPGHSGDMLAGSWLRTNHENKSMGKVADVIVENCHRFIYLSKSERDSLYGKVNDFVVAFDDCLPYSIMDWWNIKERQAKFIVNSCKAYSFFEFDFRLPLFDDELMDFFKTLPFSYKLHKRLYIETLEEYYLKPLGLTYTNDLQLKRRDYIVSQAKGVLKSVFPFFGKIKGTIADNICYSEIANQLYSQYGLSIDEEGMRNPKNLNAPIVNWYLRVLSGKLIDWYCLEENNL